MRVAFSQHGNASAAELSREKFCETFLVVGHRIWTAINDKLCVAFEDPAGELSGRIAFQIHGGLPQTVAYRNPTLTHDPLVKLAGLNEKQLNARLIKPKKPQPAKPAARSAAESRWPKLIAAIDPGSQGDAWAQPQFDHSEWKTMRLPGHFETAGLPDFDGVVWFRKTVTLSAAQAAATAKVHLGQIDDMDVSWVNGTRVGGFERPGHHYTPRSYPIPSGVLKPGRNTIAVRVMDHGAPGGIAGKANQLALQLGEQSISLATAWRFAAGADLASLNKHAALVGPQPGWTAEVRAWRAQLDARDPGIKHKWFAADFDDAQWKTMRVPGHYEGLGLAGFDGSVWFRRTVDIPETRAGQDCVLELGPIDDMDMTFFNGVKVGGIERPGFWAAARGYRVPGKLVKAGRNVITVRVMDHGWSGGFAGTPQQMRFSGGGSSTALAGRWRFQVGVHLADLGLGPLTNSGTTGAAAMPEAVVAQVPPLLRPLVRPQAPVPAFEDGFRIDSDQTIVILGGTNALESGRYGYLETLLTAAYPQYRLRLRNLAWQADTVYRQQRPRNFYAANKPGYGERDGRSRLQADIVLFWMGQTEALDGLQRIDEFTATYSRHLDQIAG
ncbi:MAG: beta galactosidase jelly roll domain-containing protein [Planctomycetaceae bacterium]